MSAGEADLMDGALVIAADQMSAALAAVESVLDAAPWDRAGGAGRVGVHGYHVAYALGASGNRQRGQHPADAARAIVNVAPQLGRHLFNDPAAGDQIAPPDTVVVSPHQSGAVANKCGLSETRSRPNHPWGPATIYPAWRARRSRRCRAGRARAQTADQAAISEAVEAVSAPAECEIEFALHSLMLEVFQADPQGVSWLRVEGLRRGVKVEHLALDIEPAYDGDGVLDGVEVVLSLFPQGCEAPVLSVSEHVSRPTSMFVAAPGVDAATAVAEIVDTALLLINAEIADRDRFTFSARDALS